MRTLRRILYWALPPVILYVIFTRIDLQRLTATLSEANLPVLSVALAVIFLKIALGGWRWYRLASGYGCLDLGVWSSLVQYWVSLTLGLVAPGSLGSDAYRIALCGRRTGHFLRGALAIVVEKAVALISCAFLVAALYPLLDPIALPDGVLNVLNLAYAVILGSAVLALGAVLALRMALVERVADWLLSRAIRVASTIQNRFFASASATGSKADAMNTRALFRLIFQPKLAFPAFALSVLMHGATALQSQLFFVALGHDLPFLVNLFVAPMILLLFTLPITFAGLGVREAAFIFLYGAFGVGAETALAVSFFSLIALFFGHAAGSVLIVAAGHSFSKNPLGGKPNDESGRGV